MRTNVLWTALALLGGAACRSTSSEIVLPVSTEGASAAARDGGGQEEAAVPDPAAYMQAMMKYATPSEVHAELAKGAGRWKVASKLFEGPGSAAVESEGSAESEMILGGRFLLERYHGSAMGMPFEGMLILGFNNLEQRYQSLWVDTWSTGFALAEGEANEDGDITLAGLMKDPISPEGRPYRHVTHHVNDDDFWVRMYDTLPDGTEWMVMELHYTRE